MSHTFRKFIVLAGILLISIIVKFPLTGTGFIHRDDPAYITENPLIREFSPAGIVKIFTTPEYMADYHPLALTFFSIEYSIFGDSPYWYHAVSLFLDLCITSMVFLFILRLSSALPVAGIVAALFALHPTHVESVAWASEQKDLLYGFFYLLSLLAYVNYAREKGSWRMYALSLAAFTLSLMSKMMAAPLALVLPAVDYLLGRSFTRRVWLEKLPFVACAVLFGIFELGAHSDVAAMLGDLSYGPWGRIALASYALAGYVGKLILPVGLSAYYPFPFPPGNIPGAAPFYVIGCLALITCAAYSLKFTRKIFFGATFFIFNVAVILQFVPAIGAFMADRYTYIASIGIFYLAAEGVQFIMLRFPAHRRIFIGAVVLVLLVLGAGTRSRAGVWRDETTLWSDVLEKYPDVAFVYVYRANARHMPSEYEGAMSDFARALQLQPDLGVGYYSRAYLESLHGNHEAAILDYGRAIELHYKQVHAFSNRGSSYASLGKYREAASDYSAAIQLDPGYADAYFNRGNIFLTTGEFTRAETDYDKSLELNPGDGETYYNRGMAKISLANASGACEDFRRSDFLGFPRAHAALAQYCR